MEIGRFMKEHGISHAEMREALGMKPPTWSRKLHGRRRWTIDEAQRVLAFLRKRCKAPQLTFDDVFGERGGRAKRRVAA